MALEIQNIQIEKDFLKAQLNPHFLFNTLNNLYGLTVRKDNLAPELILNLSDIMSYTLYESNTEIVRLEKELDFIKNYIALEKCVMLMMLIFRLLLKEKDKPLDFLLHRYSLSHLSKMHLNMA